jgi:hypothetical protein
MPCHCNMLIQMYFTASVSLNRLYISELYLPFYLPFTGIAPKMHLRILLSNEPRPTPFCALTKVSDAYITACQGLCDVRLEVYLTYNKNWALSRISTVGCLLDDRGVAFIPALGPTQLPIQWVPVTFHQV